MHDERGQLLALLSDIARKYEIEGDNAAAKRLRQCAVGVAGASDAALTAMIFVRLPLDALMTEMLTAKPN